MRIYLVLTLITFAKSQADLLSMPTGLTQDFGDTAEHIDDLNDKINSKQQADYEAEKERKINQFLADSQIALDEYVSVDNKADHEIGNFNVKFQKKCQIDMPEVELPEEPHEVDCFSGGYDGKYLAEALTKITKDNLQNPKKAMGVLYDCELIMQQELTLSLYEQCFEGEFGEYYEQYFNEFVDQMAAKNFKYDPETNKFVYRSDKVVVDRETGETKLIEANQISL